MSQSVFDREIESQSLAHLLHNYAPRSISVIGESGIGKSIIVSKCLEDEPLNTIAFSFKSQAVGSSSSFSSFLLEVNREHGSSLLEQFTRLKLNDIKFNLFALGSVTFGVLPEALDSVFFEYLFERLFRRGYRALRVENIELCRTDEDIAALTQISRLTDPHLKIVYEIGTLAPLDQRLRHITLQESHRSVFSLSRLDEAKTLGLHRFIHKSEPPPDVFRRTGGLPLAVEHLAAIDTDDPGLHWIQEKISGLAPDAYLLAYTVSNLDEPCRAEEVERIYSGSEFQTVFLGLIRANIIQEDPQGVRFKHPSFRVMLRSRPSPYLDHQILTKIMGLRMARSDGSPEFEISIVAIARRLGNRRLTKAHGLKALAGAYRAQNSLQLLYLCDALLSETDLPPRQRRVVVMIKIQSLCHLSRADDAASELESAAALLASERRVTVLRAMVACQQNLRERSNEIIASILDSLDSRSAVIALAIKIANDIPLENADAARTAFEDALALAANANLEDLQEELARLHAKLAPEPELAIERMLDYLASHNSSMVTDVGHARLIHNLGVQEMLTSDCQRGLDRLRDARSVFTRHGLNYAAYSAVTQAVAEVALGRVEDAAAMLVDAQCLCREQYDLFGVLNNLGACFLLMDKTAKALEALNKAEAAMERTEFPLRDNILLSCLHQNKALSYLKLKDFAAAQRELEILPGLTFVRKASERQARLDRILAAINDRNADFPLENRVYVKSAWMYSGFNVNFLTLSFYDFPFSLVSHDEVDSIGEKSH